MRLYDMCPKSTLPEAQEGDWRIEKFTISEQDARFFNLRQAINFRGHRSVDPGTYTRLRRNGAVIMSDTPAEIRDHLDFIKLARGPVLISGLGLGLVARACLLKPEVSHVTIVEFSEDVIQLSGQALVDEFGDRVEICQGDIKTWQPPQGARYICAWHDIWDDICADNLKDFKVLRSRYAQRCRFQFFWSLADLEDIPRQQKLKWKMHDEMRRLFERREVS